ncbi:immunity 49 family protein [Jiangella alkaliphila]|uniref:Immunity protein 49 n=1 Tax=Jiangella alkaliphila TaxID=419479 RepID=A0A1H2HGE3_9ACTN|nr:immunity 49 family protein [Jiangella alkaliphila]SDU30876.1 Immunity protein 49 [Jiangella alkaliphila]
MADVVEGHRPSRSPEELAAQLADRAEELEPLTASLPDRPGNLVELGAEALAVAGLRTLLDGDVATPLRIAARAVAAAGVLLGLDAPLQVALGGPGPVTLPLLAARPVGLGPRSLVQATHAALATRDTVALELFAAVPIERTAREPVSAEEAAYGLAHARGLQLLLRGDAAGNDLLLEALQGCTDGGLHPAARDYALFLVSPEIELTLGHLQPGGDQFDQSLRNALTLHRRYWTEVEANPGEPQDNDPAGFIALGPLAWAALRHDHGLPSAVRSDYLPASVIAGSAPAP